MQVDRHWPLVAAGPKPPGKDENSPICLNVASHQKRKKQQEHLRDASQQGSASVIRPAAGGMLGGARNTGGAAQ